MPSIYRPKDTIAPGGDVPQGTHVNTDAESNQSAASDEQSIWAGRRRAQPASVLLPATRRWLDSIPAEIRPIGLVAHFPRIANLIAVHWNSPGDCSAFIYSLLYDQRGGRRGFPGDVSRDISNLRLYYARLHPIINWEFDDTHARNQHWKPSPPKR